MASTAHLPRIGDLPVDEEALSARGTTLADLAAELCVGSSESAESTEGWRVLHSDEAGYVVVGAPIGDGLWRVGQVRPSDPNARIELHPDTMRQRPSIAERSRGLELHWPENLAADADLDALAIDVVNVGDERWVPDGEHFRAIGVLTEPGVTDFAFGAAMRAGSAVPLDPGEHTRLAVEVNPWSWTRLEPGPHDLHVVLLGLELRTEPRRVDVTAEQIARHQQSHRRPDPERRRRMLVDEADRMRLTLRAGRSLVKIAEAAASAADDDEAAGRIADVLDCDADAARSVLHSPLSELLPANASRQEQRIAEVMARIEAL